MRATRFTHEELESYSRGSLHDASTYLAQEVLYQRQWLARAARIIEAQTLDLKSLAKGRREVLTRTVEDLRDLAVGESVEIPTRLDSEYRVLHRTRRS